MILLDDKLGYNIYSIGEPKAQYIEVIGVIDRCVKLGIPVIIRLSYSIKAYQITAILGSGASHMLVKSVSDYFHNFVHDIEADRSIVKYFIKRAKEWNLIETAIGVDADSGDRTIIFVSEKAIKYITIDSSETTNENARYIFGFELPKYNDFRDTFEHEMSLSDQYKDDDAILIKFMTLIYEINGFEAHIESFHHHINETINNRVISILRSSGCAEAVIKANELELDLKI
jgi:hypothetical protein